LVTATIIDDLTDTPSDKNRECKGQGLANIGAGLLGGMAGCAMIGQSVINIKSGGRGRLSTLIAGSFLLIMVDFQDTDGRAGLGDDNGLDWHVQLELYHQPETTPAVHQCGDDGDCDYRGLDA
jgi:hypothetical protein